MGNSIKWNLLGIVIMTIGIVSDLYLISQGHYILGSILMILTLPGLTISLKTIINIKNERKN